DDEEPDERARLAPEREGEHDAVAVEIGLGGDERRGARLRLANEPAEQSLLRRALAPPALDVPAETVLVPGDERAPRQGPRLPDEVEQRGEDRAPLRSLQRRAERVGEPCRPGACAHLENDPRDADPDADRSQPRFVEAEPAQQDHEPAEREQVGTLLEVPRAGKPAKA